MGRLATKVEVNGKTYVLVDDLSKALAKLWEYEDSGMEPENVGLMRELLLLASDELGDYGQRETELTERISEVV